MLHIGKCIDLNTIEATKFLEGSSTGTWTPTSGISGKYTAGFTKGVACGGAFSAAYSAVRLRMIGCGKIKVTVSGSGGAKYSTQANVRRNSTTMLAMSTPGGGASCATAAFGITTGTNPMEIAVYCGQVVWLELYCPLANLDMPALSCEFTVEVLSP